jgi:hypothetical protein
MPASKPGKGRPKKKSPKKMDLEAGLWETYLTEVQSMTLHDISKGFDVSLQQLIELNIETHPAIRGDSQLLLGTTIYIRSLDEVAEEDTPDNGGSEELHEEDLHDEVNEKEAHEKEVTKEEVLKEEVPEVVEAAEEEAADKEEDDDNSNGDDGDMDEDEVDGMVLVAQSDQPILTARVLSTKRTPRYAPRASKPKSRARTPRAPQEKEASADLKEGMRKGAKVKGRYARGKSWYPGTISRCRPNGTFDIKYDDGDSEKGVCADMIREVEEGTVSVADEDGKFLDRGQAKCSICLNTVHDPVVLPCKHFFCHACLQQHLAQTSKDSRSTRGGLRVQCPRCSDVNMLDPQCLAPGGSGQRKASWARSKTRRSWSEQEMNKVYAEGSSWEQVAHDTYCMTHTS